MKILTDEEIKEVVDHAFDVPLYLNHVPTQWDLELHVYRMIAQAQLKKVGIEE